MSRYTRRRRQTLGGFSAESPILGTTPEEAQRTLDVIQRLYVACERPEFFDAALAVLAETVDCVHGYVLLWPAGTSALPECHLAGALGLGPAVAADFERSGASLRARLAGDPVKAGDDLAPDVAEALGRAVFCGAGSSELVVLVTRHRGIAVSAWIMARALPLSGLDRDRLRLSGTNLGYAGEVALRRGALVQGRPFRPAGALGPLRASATPTPEPGRLAIRRFPPAAATSKPETPLWAKGLPERAVKVLKLAARGYSDGEIAYREGISESTVARELASGYRHLGISGRHQLPVRDLLTD